MTWGASIPGGMESVKGRIPRGDAWGSGWGEAPSVDFLLLSTSETKATSLSNPLLTLSCHFCKGESLRPPPSPPPARPTTPHPAPPPPPPPVAVVAVVAVVDDDDDDTAT